METTTLAAELRAILARKQRSGRWLAAQSGLPHGRVARILRGDREVTLSELLSIAGALGVSTGDIIEMVERQATAA